MADPKYKVLRQLKLGALKPRKPKEWKYPFASMGVGDAFRFEARESVAVRTAASRYGAINSQRYECKRGYCRRVE